jgi:hypothetical protein
VTGKFGWELPLDRLLYKIQHSVVDGGFRGEFVTKALLCIACEDAQRALREAWEKERREQDLPDVHSESDEYLENPDPWTYSTPVTVRQFLNSLFFFREPVKPEKRKRPDDRQNVEVEPAQKTTAAVPPADCFTEGFLLPALKSNDHLFSFLDGTIFFNHWIRTEEVLRPSVLVKAWNRNAALMCKELATGIDFVIPAMRSLSPSEIMDAESRLGKCTMGKWTDPQQAAASEVISYILIQTKNRITAKPGERLADMVNTVPLDRRLTTRPNFVQHEPRHPFLSILFDFRVKRGRAPNTVHLLPTVSCLQRAHKRLPIKWRPCKMPPMGRTPRKKKKTLTKH